MKTLLRIVLVLVIIGAIAAAAYFFVLPRLQPPLEARAPGPEGAAQWAYNLARPAALSALGASDGVVVEMVGEDLFPDGRMAANRGRWILYFSSFSATDRVEVTVNHEGAVSVGAHSSPGVIRAIGSPPGTFPNSTAIFATTVGRGAAGTREVINPVRLVYDSVAGSPVWAIPFRVNGSTETHIVRWDNIWLEVR